MKPLIYLILSCFALQGCYIAPNKDGKTFDEKYGEHLKHHYSENQRQQLYEVMKNEPLKKFELIHWEVNPQIAIATAQQQQKPILVFFSVNEFAKKDTEHC
ncbi:hypothetical protein [Candidatus Uabimicrobium amorphum]|uniref:Lipoprotein n=1 Tax=Uabimicrobium amorphum TaxID=2596890 RepID=A0A5S9IRG2_UABAM|nr:hypothetical protein [Candidatus Uabimicrobium amorphum]BBM86367.1 hypothetical protein UABAM_04753 [Candidatus Uabimicrobium amorphum]